MLKRIREWQILIAAAGVSVSVLYAGSSLLYLAFNAGKAIQQHDLIIHILNQKCK